MFGVYYNQSDKSDESCLSDGYNKDNNIKIQPKWNLTTFLLSLENPI